MEEKLIDFVRERPWMYDMGSPDYKNLEKKTNSWMEISRILKISAPEVQTRWKNLRSSYVRERKRYRVGKRRKWAFFDALRFLDPHIKGRRTLSNQKQALHDYLVNSEPEESEMYDTEDSGTGQDHSYCTETQIIRLTKSEEYENASSAPIISKYERNNGTDPHRDTFPPDLREIEKVVHKHADSRQDPNIQFLKGLAVHFQNLSTEKQAALRRAILKSIIDFEEKELEVISVQIL